MGPLHGLRIVELFCIGPGPFAGMLLSDMGADILRIDRPEEPRLGYPPHKYRTLWRNRQAAMLDLKNPAGVEALLQLVEQADGFIEGYRPGVAERLGVGPDVCLERNPRLVYGRMTGWGQDGPLAQQAGFDLNYIALTGLLHVLEANLVFHNGLTVPLLSEFLSYAAGDPEDHKQDCELKAFQRLRLELLRSCRFMWWCVKNARSGAGKRHHC